MTYNALDLFSWILTYILSSYVIFLFFITLLRFILQKSDKLAPSLEISLDQLSLHWKLAPALVPYMIFVILQGAIKEIFKNK